MGLSEQYAARLDHLFLEAERQAKTDAGQIRAAAAAKGALKSGATLKHIVAAVELRSREAVDEALASLGRRPLREATRQRLREQLKERIRSHLGGEAPNLPNAQAFGPSVQGAVEELYQEAEARLVAAVDQHATGFAPGDQVSWVAAHPTLAFVITTGAALLAIIVSVAALLQ